MNLTERRAAAFRQMGKENLELKAELAKLRAELADLKKDYMRDNDIAYKLRAERDALNSSLTELLAEACYDSYYCKAYWSDEYKRMVERAEAALRKEPPCKP